MQNIHLSPRQERFCEYFLRSHSGAEAARLAGYAPDHAVNQAYRLLSMPRVRIRIEQLRRQFRRDEPAQDELIGRLQYVYERAVERGDYNAAVRATEAQSRMLAKQRASVNDRWGRPPRRFDAPLPPAADDMRTIIDEVAPMPSRSADDTDRPDKSLTPLEKSEF
jgi:hypothetical protein